MKRWIQKIALMFLGGVILVVVGMVIHTIVFLSSPEPNRKAVPLGAVLYYELMNRIGQTGKEETEPE